MKNSKGQTIPQPYLDLAMMRRDQQGRTDNQELLIASLIWKLTIEGEDLWFEVNEGNSPDIPESSLNELEEWRKKKGLSNLKEGLEKVKQLPIEQRREIAAKVKAGIHTESPYNPTAEWIDPLKVKEPDYKEMYEALKKEHEDIDKMYLELLEIHQKACAEHDRFSAETTERNYVWEAALAAMQGFIASYAGATKNPDIDTVAGISLTYAESLVAEGKKRNHI